MRKRYVDERQVDVENTAATIENMISIEMESATQSLSQIVRHVDHFIMPLVETANRLQCSYGNILFKKMIMNVQQCGILTYVLMHLQENFIQNMIPRTLC